MCMCIFTSVRAVQDLCEATFASCMPCVHVCKLYSLTSDEEKDVYFCILFFGKHVSVIFSSLNESGR